MSMINCLGCEFNDDGCQHPDGVGFIGRSYCHKFPDVDEQQIKIDKALEILKKQNEIGIINANDMAIKILSEV